MSGPRDLRGLGMSERVERVKGALVATLQNAGDDKLTPLELAELVRSNGWDPALTSIGLRALRAEGRVVGDAESRLRLRDDQVAP